jgi:hypothetical protein
MSSLVPKGARHISDSSNQQSTYQIADNKLASTTIVTRVNIGPKDNVLATFVVDRKGRMDSILKPAVNKHKVILSPNLI